jgi:NADH:ubiquinone oxidoreductase subunit 5 (subunit L)/multisubunit Na+/H+ antiporter MnhA subunit
MINILLYIEKEEIIWINVLNVNRKNWEIILERENIIFLLILNQIWLYIYVYTYDYMINEENKIRFNIYIILFIINMYIILTTNNWFILYIGWEGIRYNIIFINNILI